MWTTKILGSFLVQIKILAFLLVIKSKLQGSTKKMYNKRVRPHVKKHSLHTSKAGLRTICIAENNDLDHRQALLCRETMYSLMYVSTSRLCKSKLDTPLE